MKANLISTSPSLQLVRPINNRFNRLWIAIVVVFILLMGAYIMGGISLYNDSKLEHYLRKSGKSLHDIKEVIRELTDANDGNNNNNNGGGGGGGSGVNGTNGTNGLNSLIRQTSEPSGENCMYGGIKLDTGLDLNRDGILQQNEIIDTGYICNGMPGINGNPGINALVIVTNETIGSVHCPNGGIKIESGLDLNRNGNLIGEPTTISYVCNGLNGNNGSSIIINGGTIGQTTTTTTTTAVHTTTTAAPTTTTAAPTTTTAAPTTTTTLPTTTTALPTTTTALPTTTTALPITTTVAPTHFVCTSSAQCNGFQCCLNSTCFSQIGQPCVVGTDCVTGHCTGNTCTWNNPNESCCSNFDCANGQTCQNNICITINPPTTTTTTTTTTLNTTPLVCAPGTANCDGISANGCETNLLTSTNHCGTCSNNCATLPHVSASHCLDGVCVIDLCVFNPLQLLAYGNCDNISSNGCETNLINNDINCGSCGNTCIQGEFCISGIGNAGVCTPI